ncbi:MAG: PKD domain-containing protein, partial [Saprospiraceae bacterium]|nr:PKD domain-containing protein [Saprospiraceae bacterium]
MLRRLLLCILVITSLTAISQTPIIEIDPYKKDVDPNSLRVSRAGCNPDLTISPAFDCATAAQSAINGAGTGFVCDLEGFCINTGTVPQLNPPIPFCSSNSVLNNPIWFSFIADGTGILDIDVLPSGCNGGIQWALYDQCGNYMNAIACQSNPILPADQPFNIYVSPTTPGATYYLVIDGANGASCDYEFHVNDGISPIYVGDPLGTTLTGNTNVCGGSTVTYSFPGIQYGTDYHWTLPDGSILDTEGPTTTVSFPEGMTPGTYQLCVTASNDCDENADAVPVCWDIIIGEEPILDVYGEVCPGDTYSFRGGNYPAGEYSFNYLGPAGSSCDTTINLHVTNFVLSTTPDQQIFVCPGEQFAFISGIPVQVGTSANTLTFMDHNGCDSLVNYYVNELEANGVIGAVPASLPCGGTASATLSLNPDWGFFTVDSYSIEWFDSNNMSLGTGNTVNITSPGYYYAKVTWYKVNNLLPGTDVSPTDILCEKLFDITIPAENSTLQSPVTAGPTVLCAGEVGDFSTNTQAGTTSYTWKHPGGVVTGGGSQEQ